MSFLTWLELFQPVAPAGATVAAGAPCAQEYLAAQHLESPVPGELAAAVASAMPATAEWQGAISALLTGAILPIQWSARPPVRVSLERLLASPGRRRTLATPGRLRLLKRP